MTVVPGLPADLQARIRRFLTERTPEAVLNRSLAILAAVTAVTACFSDTFFFPDEHYQVLEWVSYKLGTTRADQLPWEFAAHARSWMQPFLYYLIAKPLVAAGLHDLFSITFILRAVTACVSLAALVRFAKLFLGDLSRTDERFAYARMLPFMGFLPYLFVRTASETLSGAFVTLGLALAVEATRSGRIRRMAVAGALCGLAFECRYQTAVLTLGLLAWLAVFGKARLPQLAAIVAGGLAVVAAGVLVDRWGYGVWCLPPWDYIYVNLVEGIAANRFGSAPFYAYIYLVPANIFFPIALTVMLAMIVACLRNPRHYVTWATAPFFLVHCAFAHKEDRFLFPLAILATSYPVLAFAPGRPLHMFERLWAWRRSWLAKAVGWSAVAAMLFLAVWPFGIRPHLRMARYLYRHFPQGITAYTRDDEAFTSYPMYRPPHFRSSMLASDAQLAALLAKGPVYLFSEEPSPPRLPAGAQATLLYSEFPFAGDARAAAWATHMMCDFADLRRTTGLAPPRLAWMTLFRIRAGAPGEAATPAPPCTPVWHAATATNVAHNR